MKPALSFLLFILLTGHSAQPQFNTGWTGFQAKNVSAIAAPEINLSPLPSRVIIFRDADENDRSAAREKKQELIEDCTDSLLSEFTQKISSLLPQMECILVPSLEKNETIKDPYKLLQEYQASLAFGIGSFRPAIQQGEVTVERKDDGSKDRTASYFIRADGQLHIYNKNTLVKTFPFSESQFLENRSVLSGLLAVGPSLVNNRKAVYSVTKFAAIHLAEKFVAQRASFSLHMFNMKEVRELTQLIMEDKFDEALTKALELTSHKKEAVAARAHYYCAAIYHHQGDFAKAFQHISKAKEMKDIPGGQLYYQFLKKQAEDNRLTWNDGVIPPVEK